MRKIKTQEALVEVVKRDKLSNLAFQELNLTEVEHRMMNISVKNCLFLDCKMSNQLTKYLFKDNYIFPRLNVPYSIYPSGLYNKEKLYNGYNLNQPESYLKP